MKIFDYLDYWAVRTPDACCASDGSRSVTYAQMRDWSYRIGQWLTETHEPGSRVVIAAKNTLEQLALYYGAARAGVVSVPLNTRLAPAEWAYICNDIGVETVISDAEFVDAIDAIRSDLERPLKQSLVIGSRSPQWGCFGDTVEAHPAEPPQRHVSDDGPLYQSYTSGTTGRPKGAVITHRNADAAMVGLRTVIEQRRGAYLMVMPIFHGAAMIQAFTNVSTGTTTRIVRDYDPTEALRIMKEEQITATTLVAAMLQGLLKHPNVGDFDYPDLRYIIYGGGTVPPEVVRQGIEVFGCGFMNGYGMTEATGGVTILSPEDHLLALKSRPGLLLSCGREVPGTQVRIVDRDDKEVPIGEVGEILVRGPQVMSAYWGLAEATAETLRGGWLHTGDAGRRDDDGFYYISDRVKDMYISGGENVYPREVEEVLLGHLAVREVAVVGIPDNQWGEVGKAFVVLEPGAVTTETDITEHCRGRLAGYKRPRHVEFVDELPRNATGKVLKRILRKPYWEGRVRTI
jgi:acyl-CoA synthetase (AMP-forming)/AMP-acid ligase II